MYVLGNKLRGQILILLTVLSYFAPPFKRGSEQGHKVGAADGGKNRRRRRSPAALFNNQTTADSLSCVF